MTIRHLPSTPRSVRTRASRGMTLIELLIVLAVVAILALVAWPAYDEQVRRARRSEARELIHAIAVAQERWYSNHQAYAPTLAALGITSTRSPHGHYEITMTATDADGYTLVAAPLAHQASDACGSFTYNDLGVRDVAGGTLPRDRCW